MVSATVYLYFQPSDPLAAAATVVPPDASRSDFSRKRVFGCQTKRRKSAVQITENTPATTSVMRWVGAQPDAKNCMMAKERPETTAPGQTSKASAQVPPSIFTKVTTSQKGTSTETQGSWWPAIEDRVS